MALTITIPAGRMRGDINGDGKITNADRDIIIDHLSEEEGLQITNSTALLCADANGDGEIDLADRMLIARIAAGMSGYTAGRGGDVLGNWKVNPNYKTDAMQFYTDIPVSGMEAGDSAIVSVHGSYEAGFFRGESRKGELRLYAKLCPIKALKATVQFGAVFVVCED